MRSSTRVLILKIGAAAAALALIVAAMHFLLPGLARRHEQSTLGSGYAIEETEQLSVAVPRSADSGPPGTRLSPWIAAGFNAFTQALYRQYGELLSLQPVDDKITIRVFASHAELVAFAGRRMKQDASHAGGFYDPASWSIALTLRPRRELFAMLSHEATHLIMDRSATGGEPDWSLWLSEGMAVYFEQSAIVNRRLRLGGASPRDAAVVLALAARGRHVPLHKLVGGGPELFRGELGPLAYREAGLLVAFLLEGADGKLREPFVRYYQLERKPGPCPAEALASTLGVPLDALETLWLTYLRGIAR